MNPIDQYAVKIHRVLQQEALHNKCVQAPLGLKFYIVSHYIQRPKYIVSYDAQGYLMVLTAEGLKL